MAKAQNDKGKPKRARKLQYGNYRESILFVANERLRQARSSIGLSREEVLTQAGINPEEKRQLKTNREWYELLEANCALPFFPGDFLRPLLKALNITVAVFKVLQGQALVEASKPSSELTIVVRLMSAVYQRECLPLGTTLPHARSWAMQLSRQFHKACLRTTLTSVEYYEKGRLAFTAANIPSGGINNTSPNLDFDPDSFVDLVLKDW